VKEASNHASLTPKSARSEILDFLRDRKNWGRWGPDDELGTINLITEDAVRRGFAAARTGRTLSLSRNLPVMPAPNNPRPALLFVETRARPDISDPEGPYKAGVATDFVGIACHGTASTHIDALCHAWDSFGMWNGRDPEQGFDGMRARWGSVYAWRRGIATRCVLLDVPSFRGSSHVTSSDPVSAAELYAIAEQQGTPIESGDAVAVYCGRDQFELLDRPWGATAPEQQSWPPTGEEVRPGLDSSCVEPLREWDVSVLLWDMLDNSPNGRSLPWSVHAAISHFGLALIDNADLSEIARECRAREDFSFFLVVAPLPIEGATGSVVNPIAII
jgi:kynurenine formamidase